MPAPFGPTRPTTDPGGTENVQSRRPQDPAVALAEPVRPQHAATPSSRVIRPLPSHVVADHRDQRGHRVVAEPGLVGFAEPVRQRRAQCLAGACRGRGQGGGDERALPRPAACQALVFQLAVRLNHRVGVDRQVARDLLDRRQPVPLAQVPKQQRLPHLVHDLQVGRDPEDPSSRNLNITLLPSSHYSMMLV